MKKLFVMMLTFALLLAATGCAFQTPQTTQEQEDNTVEIGETQEGAATYSDAEKPAEDGKKDANSDDAAKGEDDSKTEDANKDNEAQAGGDATAAEGEKAEDGNTQNNTGTEGQNEDSNANAGSNSQGNGSNGNSAANTGSNTGSNSNAQNNKGYDNGSLTTSQIKEMQRWYGISADGQWGSGSKAKAGGLDADAAWAKYQAAKAAANNNQNNNQGGTGNQDTGNQGNNSNTGSSGQNNTGSGSQGNNGNGISGQDGGSGQAITPSKPAAHTHRYIKISQTDSTCTTEGSATYRCTCGDSYTEKLPLARHSWEPVYGEVEVTEMQGHTFCGSCGMDLTAAGFTSEEKTEHVKTHALAGEGSRTYEEFVTVVTGTETQVVGYKCSVCGVLK